MTTRVIKSERDREALVRFIKSRPLPFTANIATGKHRTIEQNRLQMALIKDIAEQMGETTEDVRAYCKLCFGVPILRAENPDFCERYDAIVRPLPYATKLALMKEPFDFPVSRIMKVDQLTRYIDALTAHYAEQGVAFSVMAA